jgi:hypothetical protein
LATSRPPARPFFNGAVVRFRESIETNRLKKVGDICDADLAAIEAGMTKASKWEGGHDHASAVDDPVPPPAELKADIDALETWVKVGEGAKVEPSGLSCFRRDANSSRPCLETES